jgi:hypothetical protein
MHHRQSRRQSQRIEANRIRVHERVGTDIERLHAAGDLFDRWRNLLGTSEFRADDIGTQPLPVQQATKVELILKLATAKILGVTFPLILLTRADEVIE